MSDNARIPTSSRADPVTVRAAKPRFRDFQVSEADNALLQRLSEDHRLILLVQHGSYADIAQQLNLAPGTVRSRLHRARDALTKLRAEAAAGGPGNPMQKDQGR